MCIRDSREYLSSTLSYRCSYRGITINHKEEITWHEFVMALLRMGLYTFKDNNCDKEEQIPGQDDIYNHPEYLPDDNVTDFVTINEQTKTDNEVLNIEETQRVADVRMIGNCPYCNAPLIFISNKRFCGSCGKGIVWQYKNESVLK